MRVEIDPHAGFCYGVDRAISIATKHLDDGESLFSLGEIVHNHEEVLRLSKAGMQTLDHNSMESATGKKVLIRAHGEPPETFVKAEQNHLQLIDATCPIVIKLQQKVKNAFEEMNEKGGQIILIGDKKHPELIGLFGQTDQHALIIGKTADVNKINMKLPMMLFAQTTTPPFFYEQIVDLIEKKLETTPGCTTDYRFRKSLCRYVSGRVPKIEEFSKSNDVIVFIAGANSSNAKALFDICKKNNPKSYFISHPNEFEVKWVQEAKTVGVSGATSTPAWLMENLAEKIKKEAVCISSD